MTDEEAIYRDLQGNANMHAKSADRNRSEAQSHIYRKWIGQPEQGAAECQIRAAQHDAEYIDTINAIRRMEFKNPSLKRLKGTL